MNSRKLSVATLATILFLGASSAAVASDMWGGSDQVQPQEFVSSKTRAEVVAELKEARSSAFIQNGEILATSYQAAVTPTRARSDVRAEAVEALQASNHQADRFYYGAQ